MHSMPKLKTYRLFKEIREKELYLTLNIPRRLRVSLARFRTGSHNFEVEVGRHKKMNVEVRLCRFCGMMNNLVCIEDEYHVLFHCIAYKDIRNMNIGGEIFNQSLHSFVSIMKNNNPQIIVNLAHFINSMFKTRKGLCKL